ncbi:MAG: histidine kinase [Lewinellaceae bacterium]|nr:histidine kinase [Lewinellaceae bacterium]
MKPLALSILCCLLGSLCAPAQNLGLHLEAYTYRNGLSDNRVRAVMQDEKGFLWIGTANGLNRFDGYTFWHYFPVKGDSTSISSPTVNKIVKDREGALWMATANGICRLRRGPWIFERVFTFPDQIKNSHSAYFLSVYPDPYGKVWAVNSNGELYCIDPRKKQGELIEMPAVPNPPAVVPGADRSNPARPVSVVACGDTAVLIGTNYGFFTLQIKTRAFRFIPVEEAWPSGLGKVVYDGPQAVWCGSFMKGVIRVDLKTGQRQHYLDPEPTPHGILTVESKRLWLAGVSGLSSFNPAMQHVAKIKLPFEDAVSPNATSLFRDRAGTIWIGTDNGLVKYDPNLQGFNYTEVHRETSTIYENDICDVLHNPDDGQWYVVSRQQSAIYVLDSLNQLRKRISTLPHTEPTRIFRDSKGRIWITTRFQVLEFDPRSGTVRPVPTPPRREGRVGLIWTVDEDPQGRLWFGVSRDGIFIYDPETRKYQQPGPEQGFDASRIYRIVFDREKRFAWIGTTNEGFYECDLKTMRFHRYDDQTWTGLDAEGAMVQDLDGNLWLGTTEGLVRYNPNLPKKAAFRSLTMEDGLPMNLVEGGILDASGMLWFGAGERLVRVNPKNLQIKVFDYRYGASRTPFGYYDFCKSASTGELYAGGQRGFLRWFPDQLQENQVAPAVVVTNLKAAREDIAAPTSEVAWIRLPYDENNFRVEFAALNYTLPDANLYQWKLQGYDDDWSAPSSRREAIYAHIPPGNYQLKVKAANNDGVWNAEPLVINVNIVAAFWQTWWFMALVLLTLGALVYGAIRWRFRQLQEQARLKTVFNQRLAEIEMSALRAQMNPHFVFNCLNSVNRYILLNQPLVASQYLTKFARLIRLVLDNSRSDVISLEKEIETLRLYIEMEALRFANRFTFRIEMDEAIDPGSIDIPPMLIQPYVENAIWHGLLHKKNNEGELEIRLSLANKDLVIEVRDNGVGRAAANVLKSKSASERKSYGMDVTAERLSLLSKLYKRPIHFHIDDLVHADGAAAGTRVVLTVPVLE